MQINKLAEERQNDFEEEDSQMRPPEMFHPWIYFLVIAAFVLGNVSGYFMFVEIKIGLNLYDDELNLISYIIVAPRN